MHARIHPLWWPALAGVSPVLVPALALRNRGFRRERERAEQLNNLRLARAEPLDLVEVEYLEWTVLVDYRTAEGFLGSPGVSYALRTDRGTLLMDVGFGADQPALLHNAERLGFRLDQVDALAISHLHPDHMGGMQARRHREVRVPAALGSPGEKPCFLPDEARAPGFAAQVVRAPRNLVAGVATLGPLARSLFVLGWTEEQALVVHVRGKGLVVITGCGHPKIERILAMVRRISPVPVHAVGGGLHFPLKRGRGWVRGIEIQMLLGTGKPPWERITEEDLQVAVAAINEAAPQRVLLSAHDTDDYALERFAAELRAETTVLEAGRTYRF